MNFGFSLFPPEILSGLMYTGPGSGPLTTAATAWTNLGEELTTTATSVQSQVSGLNSSWGGAGAAAATASISPYVTWLETTATQAGQMAAQATTAAALFETAHAATVPPPVIATNRSLLLALIATNFFGQNTPAIATTEAQYEAMWGVDVATMNTYSTASETNISSSPQFTAPSTAAKTVTAPPLSSDPTGGLANLINHFMPSGSQIPAGSSLSDIWSSVMGALTGAGAAGGDAATAAGTASLFQSLYYPLMMASLPARILPSLLMQMARMGSMGAMGASGALAGQAAGAEGATGTLMTQIGDFVNDKLHGAVGTLVGHFNTATNAISAKLGQAASMGSLKVPQGWAAAADGMVRAAPVLPHTTVSAPVQTTAATSGMPGGPFGNAMMGAMAGRGLGSVAAKAPKIIPRSPSGG